MTTIVALRDGKNGVFIGSDMQYSCGGRKVPVMSPTGKWCVSEDGDWAFGYCGRVRTANILFGEKEAIFAGLKSPDSFIVRVHNVLLDYKVSSRLKDDESTDRHDSMDVAFILTDGRRIWAIHEDYSIVPIDTYVADGSGGDVALGALCAISGIKSIEPRKKVQIALESAMTHDIHSGMGLFIAYVKAN